VGDSSWAAGPHLADYTGVVCHQVRHPLAVVTSLANGILFLEREGPYYAERIKYFDVSGDNVLDSMRCYQAFYQMAEQNAHMTWRVEACHNASHSSHW